MKGLESARNESAREKSSPGRFVADLLLRNWGLKALAFILAVVLFVFTRDEVTRVFTVPLRVVEDPERVLMTELPETIRVQARGPWTRINRLQPYDFGVATLDLDKAKPGPLEIDRAGIVMPAGVVLAAIQYDQVDLRFDPVVQREIVVKPRLEGTVAADYEFVGAEVQPDRWMVRGGESAVDRVEQLFTEPLDIDGADQDLERARPLAPLPEGVALVGDEEQVMVVVHVVVNARHESRRYTVPVVVPKSVDPMGVVPRTYEVAVSGPLPDFRVLDGLDLSAPVYAEAVRIRSEVAGGEDTAEIRFSWASGVPEELRARLGFDRKIESVRLPAPPAPPPTLDLPEPG